MMYGMFYNNKQILVGGNVEIDQKKMLVAQLELLLCRCSVISPEIKAGISELFHTPLTINNTGVAGFDETLQLLAIIDMSEEIKLHTGKRIESFPQSCGEAIEELSLVVSFLLKSLECTRQSKSDFSRILAEYAVSFIEELPSLYKSVPITADCNELYSKIRGFVRDAKLSIQRAVSNDRISLENELSPSMTNK